ncbi:MAG: hypothetical protein JXR40_03855 [Pontiellaceae bacterium]|nr:hypothetical protein [Pontiellaceae bacterium]
MSEEQTIELGSEMGEEGGTLFDSLTTESGGGVLGDITAAIPQADPAVREMLSSGSGSETTGGTGSGNETVSSENGPEKPVLEVDPKVYTYVQDHKGRPFDPEKHQVDANGNPVFNARGRVKRLEPGQENPVRLVFNNLKSFLLPEKERPQEECVAQAVAQSVETERMQSAEVVVDLYGGAGYALRGAPFRKNWEKFRRKKLVDAIIRYQRLKNITIPVQAEMILVHAFGTDLLTVEGEVLFEKKGGLLGFIGRKGWNKRAQTLVDSVDSKTEREIDGFAD